jgi:hypothetical protein
MSIKVYENALSNVQIASILSNPVVLSNKELLKSSDRAYFTVRLSESIKKSLKSKIGLDLNKIDEIPMRWIKGNTHLHTDKGRDTFLNTYIVYLTDSIGNLVINSNNYNIKKGTAFIFNEGLSHKTIDTEDTERLMIGPMSEDAF